MAIKEETSKGFLMVGGNGADSYSQNSTYQGGLLIAARERINKVIFACLNLKNQHFDPSFRPLTIADFGCSTGPNTFTGVQNIIEAVNGKYENEITKPNNKNIDFVVFFNDHSGNDFNTLFKTLPEDRRYFAVGVPGSFYNQVLPTNSLHIGHSNYALHYLTKAPNGITNPDSPAWNKDIHCSGFVKNVAEAYLEQFMDDMDRFLNVRAKEFVPGGLLLVLGSCLPDGVLMSETVKGMLLDCLGSCLVDMVKSGKISQTTYDSFNVLLYFAHVSELKQAVGRNGKFTIETIERVSHANEQLSPDSKTLTCFAKATLGFIVADHFGEKVFDEIMVRYEQTITERIPEFVDAKNGMQFFMVLRRN